MGGDFNPLQGGLRGTDAGGGGRGTWGDGNMQKYLERASKSTAATDDTIKAVCSLKKKKKKTPQRTIKPP